MTEMRNPKHCCFENLNLEFVSDCDIRISNFILLQLGLVDFHAAGFVDRISGQ
jgi:hypothetical protein